MEFLLFLTFFYKFIELIIELFGNFMKGYRMPIVTYQSNLPANQVESHNWFNSFSWFITLKHYHALPMVLRLLLALFCDFYFFILIDNLDPTLIRHKIRMILYFTVFCFVGILRILILEFAISYMELLD